MPTYDYECEKCGYIFEMFQSITAPPLKTCPKCRGEAKRLIGRGAGVIFKGAGFYATDYKKGKKSKEDSCPLNKQDRGCKPRPCTYGRGKSCPHTNSESDAS